MPSPAEYSSMIWRSTGLCIKKEGHIFFISNKLIFSGFLDTILVASLECWGRVLFSVDVFIWSCRCVCRPAWRSTTPCCRSSLRTSPMKTWTSWSRRAKRTFPARRARRWPPARTGSASWRSTTSWRKVRTRPSELHPWIRGGGAITFFLMSILYSNICRKCVFPATISSI